MQSVSCNLRSWCGLSEWCSHSHVTLGRAGGIDGIICIYLYVWWAFACFTRCIHVLSLYSLQWSTIKNSYQCDDITENSDSTCHASQKVRRSPLLSFGYTKISSMNVTTTRPSASASIRCWRNTLIGEHSSLMVSLHYCPSGLHGRVCDFMLDPSFYEVWASFESKCYWLCCSSKQD